MKRKILLLMLATIMAFTGIFGFTSCKSDTPPSSDPEEKHEHTFSTEWTSDEKEHWHRCTGCTANTPKELHEWDSGTVITPSGCGTTGTMKYTCTVCGREKTETTPAGTHTFDTKWSCNETEHWHAATCGHDLVSEQGKHEWNEQNVCSVCGYEMQYTEGLEYRKAGSVQNVKLIVASIGTATDTDLVIPAYAQVEGEMLPVKGIDENAFSNNMSITSVIIPEGITSIPEQAFFNCKNLVLVSLPDSVTAIGKAAFSDCSKLGNIELPEKLTQLEPWCFKDCDSMTEVTIPWYVQYIDSAFLGCDSLKKVVFEKNNTLIKIRDFSGAFSGCRALESVTIPDGVEAVSAEAFNGCVRLTSITLPDTIETIGESAFKNCTGLITITVPENVTSIESNAFSGCTHLIEVYNKSSLIITAGESSNGYIAWNAKNVYTPTSGNSMLAYTDDGFVFILGENTAQLISYVGSDKEITLPDSVTADDGTVVTKYTISETAFDFSPDITDINVSAENESYSSVDGVLYDKIGMTLVRVPTGRSGHFVIPDNVYQMEYFAFFYCAKLESITFNDRITTVEYDCFTGCSGLTSVTLGKAVNDFNGSKLEGSSCPDIREINVSEDNKYYKSYGGVLYDYDMTTVECLPYGISGELVIPDGVQYLGSDGLRSNPNITSVSLPSSLKRLGYGFYNCSNLTSVTFSGTMAQWKEVSGTKVNGAQTWRNGAVYDAIVCKDGSIQRTQDKK